MRWMLLSFAIVAASCAARERAAWVPRLALHGQLARPIDGAASEVDWRVGAALYFASDPPVVIVEEPLQAPTVGGMSACAHAALCAWEERARALAIAREEEP